jgi:hypothetical protein
VASISLIPRLVIGQFCCTHTQQSGSNCQGNNVVQCDLILTVVDSQIWSVATLPLLPVVPLLRCCCCCCCCCRCPGDGHPTRTRMHDRRPRQRRHNAHVPPLPGSRPSLQPRGVVRWHGKIIPWGLSPGLLSVSRASLAWACSPTSSVLVASGACGRCLSELHKEISGGKSAPAPDGQPR